MEPREIFHDKRKLFSMEDLLPECLSDTGKKRKKKYFVEQQRKLYAIVNVEEIGVSWAWADFMTDMHFSFASSHLQFKCFNDYFNKFQKLFPIFLPI